MITDDINKVMLQIARFIRTRYYSKDNNIDNTSTFKKQIYAKNLQSQSLQWVKCKIYKPHPSPNKGLVRTKSEY